LQPEISMSSLSARLTLVIATLGLAAAGTAAWMSWQNRQEMRAGMKELAALSVRPALMVQADARPGAGLYLSNQGVGPAVVQEVRMALAAPDGTLTWMGYPDAANGANLNLWQFLGLPSVNEGLPEGVAAIAAPPQAGTIYGPGQGADLIRFPPVGQLPAEWRSANEAAADAALQGLMLCITYQGLDGNAYRLDRGGLCTREITDKDRRYTGSAP